MPALPFCLSAVRTPRLLHKFHVNASALLCRCLLVLAACLGIGFCEPASAQTTLAFTQDFLAVLNPERKAAGLGLLSESKVLGRAAQSQAAAMARHNRLEKNLDGYTPFDRLQEEGYVWFSATALISNGGKKDSPPKLATRLLAQSPKKTALLSGYFTEAGVGGVKDNKGRWWWAVFLAAPD